MFLFGLTWLFGALTVTGFGSVTASFAFQVLFVICNAFQGFFIFLFFCAFNKDARHLWLELLSCGHYKSKPFRSSKAKYATSGGIATFEKNKTATFGFTNSNVASPISSTSGYDFNIDKLSKEKPLVVTFENDTEIYETKLGTAQKDDLELSEVKEKDQVPETSNISEEHAFSNTWKYCETFGTQMIQHLASCNDQDSHNYLASYVLVTIVIWSHFQKCMHVFICEQLSYNCHPPCI